MKIWGVSKGPNSADVGQEALGITDGLNGGFGELLGIVPKSLKGLLRA